MLVLVLVPRGKVETFFTSVHYVGRVGSYVPISWRLNGMQSIAKHRFRTCTWSCFPFRHVCFVLICFLSFHYTPKASKQQEKNTKHTRMGNGQWGRWVM